MGLDAYYKTSPYPVTPPSCGPNFMELMGNRRPRLPVYTVQMLHPLACRKTTKEATCLPWVATRVGGQKRLVVEQLQHTTLAFIVHLDGRVGPSQPCSIGLSP